MIALLLKAGKTRILAGVVCLVVATAVLDWLIGETFSLGILYILPMMLGALVLRWWQTALLALVCAFLRYLFDVPSSAAESVLRFLFASASYLVSGLFVSAIIRNRQVVAEHLANIQKEQ